VWHDEMTHTYVWHEKSTKVIHTLLVYVTYVWRLVIRLHSSMTTLLLIHDINRSQQTLFICVTYMSRMLHMCGIHVRWSHSFTHMCYMCYSYMSLIHTYVTYMNNICSIRDICVATHSYDSYDSFVRLMFDDSLIDSLIHDINKRHSYMSHMCDDSFLWLIRLIHMTHASRLIL
jgi:hypothetical protein